MSQPYSTELFAQRPIRKLVEMLDAEALYVPSTCPIVQTVQVALSRPLDARYEPVAVVFPDGAVKLLDCHVLLSAQSQIVARANQMLQKEKERARRYAATLEREREQVRVCAARLQLQQRETEGRNQRLVAQGRELAAQKDEIAAQAREIARLNQQFVQLGRYVSREGAKTFAALCDSVAAILRRTDEIVDIGRTLSRDLGTLQQAAKAVERLRQEIQNAVFEVSKLSTAGRQLTSTRPHSLSAEVINLSSRSFDLGDRAARFTDRFAVRIQALTAAARDSAEVAQALERQSQQTRRAIAELTVLAEAGSAPNAAAR